MTSAKRYFFCGIGGSGMLPLALILRGQGAEVAGSDRSLDQGRTSDKFAFLESNGIALFPQDGSGVTDRDQILVTSAAIEESVPDVAAARQIGAERLTRPQLLAQLFNAAPQSIAVGGTSGKSTTTGMIAWILDQAGRDPIVMNGAVMKNFAGPAAPFASARVGNGDIFVSEVDESDGSIAFYEPAVAVLNNISLDHKSLEELRGLFLAFLNRSGHAIVNLDDAECRALASAIPADRITTFSLAEPDADLLGTVESEEPFAIGFTVRDRRNGAAASLRMPVPGRHNAANALAAIAAAGAASVGLDAAVTALESFAGLRRRFELVGTRNDIAVIDDFGHNPDKIAATLATLRVFPGRLLVFFQPHGYGPLKVMKDALIACFAERLGADDILVLCDPAYFGGTVERSVGSGDIVAGVRAAGRNAEHVPERVEAGARLVELARPGDRIVVMGARDDTLSAFAAELLERL